LQTEEENPEGADAVAVELESCHDVTFANTFIYRVSRNVIMPKPYAVVAGNSANVVFDTSECSARPASPSTIASSTRIAESRLRAHHSAHFVLSRGLRRGVPLPLPEAFAPKANPGACCRGIQQRCGPDGGQSGYGLLHRCRVAHDLSLRRAPHGGSACQKWRHLQLVLGFVAPATLLAVNSDKSVSLVRSDDGSVTPVDETDSPTGGHAAAAAGWSSQRAHHTGNGCSGASATYFAQAATRLGRASCCRSIAGTSMPRRAVSPSRRVEPGARCCRAPSSPHLRLVNGATFVSEDDGRTYVAPA